MTYKYKVTYLKAGPDALHWETCEIENETVLSVATLKLAEWGFRESETLWIMPGAILRVEWIG